MTTVPTQALFFLNNPLVHLEPTGSPGGSWTRRGATATASDGSTPWPSPAPRRSPSATWPSLPGRRPDLLARDGRAPDRETRDAWASLVRTMIASNEFLYVD